MEEDKPFKPLEKEKIELTTKGDSSPASVQHLKTVADKSEKTRATTSASNSSPASTPTEQEKPWLLVPRIKCDAPGAERHLHRPNIIFGILVGVMLPFVFLELAFSYHQYMNTYVNGGLMIAGILFMMGQYRLNRFLTYKFRKPFFVEFAFGVFYPAAKLLSFMGFNLLEGYCFGTLADCMQEFNKQVYNSECLARVISLDKPLQVFCLGAEQEYGQSLLLSGQKEKAVHYVEERIRYWKDIIDQSKSRKEEGIADFALRNHFAAIIYESIGETEKANKFKQAAYDRVQLGKMLGGGYNTGVLCKAEILYSEGRFEETANLLEEYFSRVDDVKWDELYSFSHFFKARAAIFLALCYAKLDNDTKVTEYVDLARKETAKDRSTINRINEQFMLAELEQLKGNREQAREILLGVKETFLSDQSSHVSFLLKQKADQLGFDDLFKELAQPIPADKNEFISCKHHKEECSYIDDPVKVVAEYGLWHKAMLVGFIAGFISFIGSMFKGPISPLEMSEIQIIGLPILIALIWLGFKKSRKMARLNKSLRESRGKPVMVKLHTLVDLEIIDPESNMIVGKYAINEKMHEALKSRVSESFPAKMYKQGDEVLGLEMFGYVTAVSNPKK